MLALSVRCRDCRRMARSTPSLHPQSSHLPAAAPKEYRFLAHSRATLVLGTAICCAACAWTRTVPAGVSIIVYRREFGSGQNAGLLCLRQRIKVIGVVVADLQPLGYRRSSHGRQKCRASWQSNDPSTTSCCIFSESSSNGMHCS